MQLINDRKIIPGRLQHHHPGSEVSLRLSLGGAVFYALLGTVFLTAIPFGTVDPWFKAVFVLMICLLAALRLTDAFLKRESFFCESGLLLPLTGILVLAGVQIMPFAGGETISLDPYHTADFIILFIALLAAFEILLFYTKTRHRLGALIIMVIAIGFGSAFFGLFREYLIDSEGGLLSAYFKPGIGYAQFINRNHFVFLMEMSLGLLLGILLKGELSEGLRFLGWVLTGILVLASISVNSRGGIMSLAGMAVLAFFLHFLTKNKPSFETKPGRRQRKKTWFIKAVKATSAAILTFGIIVFIVAFVGGDQVVNRLEGVPDEMVESVEGKIRRADIWQSTWELIKEKPIAGTGFGAYGAAITRYDHTGGRYSLQQAHNDYLEILAGGGVAAMILVIVFAAVVLKKALIQFNSRDSFRRASCFGAALGIIGVILHSTVDFGLHVVTNSLIFIILIVIATARVNVPVRSARPAEDS